MPWWTHLTLPIAMAAALQAAPAAPLPQEAYVWQRLWTPPVHDALREMGGLFQGWRVLAAETGPNGRLKGFAVDWKAVAGKPVTAVVRIDGALGRFDAKALLAELRALMARWPTGVGLEIDYDCGTASLAAYAAFLKDVRTHHPSRLSITALPAWLGSPDLVPVLAAVDEAVLQVHAVRSPAQGLFDVKLARRWIDRMDNTEKPFRVALPDYGTRVIRSSGGSVIALESEAPKLIGGASAEELTATPDEVAVLLRDLERRPPKHLAGIAWFRLPVKGDARIWSRETLAAVIKGEALTGRLTVRTRPGLAPGSDDILLVNDGGSDVALPRAVHLSPGCTLADGGNGYRFEAKINTLVRLQNVLIHAHHAQVIGWARCGAARGDFHVEP